MTGALFVEVAEAGDDCILTLFRTGDARPSSFRLDVPELVHLVDTLTRARQWMRPGVPSECSRLAGWQFVPDLWLEVPKNQPTGTGTVTYLVRHPAQGWLASEMRPDHARYLSGAFLAYSCMAQALPPKQRSDGR